MPRIEVHESIARVPVSIRLPATLYQSVERYAQQHRLKKTDAFIHFIEQGMQAEEGHDVSPSADTETQRKLDMIIDMLHQQASCDASHIQSTPNICDRQDERNEIIAAIQKASARFPAIERAYLFGSVARGAFTDQSDIDVRIELDRSMSFNLHDLVHFSKLIEQATGREADVVSARLLKNKSLARSIEADKELVYEREI